VSRSEVERCLWVAGVKQDDASHAAHVTACKVLAAEVRRLRSSMLQQPAEAELVHRVCTWLREETMGDEGNAAPPCKGCELTTPSPYGPGTLGCVLRAQELIALVQPSKKPPAASPLSVYGYAMSEPHLSGYRLILGFETLEQVQAAHSAVAELSKEAKAAQ
jgi:hypothetical protein